MLGNPHQGDQPLTHPAGRPIPLRGNAAAPHALPSRLPWAVAAPLLAGTSLALWGVIIWAVAQLF
jgi:hypothetical protein